MSTVKTIILAFFLMGSLVMSANHPGDVAKVLSPDLTVSIIEEDVNLQWDAYADAKEFIVEVATAVSASGDMQFETIGTVKANGSVRYAFIDKSQKAVGIRYYRVTQIMNHGVSLTSDVQSANFLLKDYFTSNVRMDEAFSALTVQINAKANGSAFISLENIMGTQVFNSQVAVTRGFNNYEFAVPSTIEDGMYLLQITCQQATQTVMLQKMSSGELIVKR